MLQILTPRYLKIMTLLIAGVAASAFRPAVASGTEEDRDAATKDAVAYYAALEELKGDYADRQALDEALKGLARDLAAEKNDLFEMPSNVKVFDSELELVDEFPLGETQLSDEDKLMIYQNTTYYIK